MPLTATRRRFKPGEGVADGKAASTMKRESGDLPEGEWVSLRGKANNDYLFTNLRALSAIVKVVSLLLPV
jgi:hypothetical protein